MKTKTFYKEVEIEIDEDDIRDFLGEEGLSNTFKAKLVDELDNMIYCHRDKQPTVKHLEIIKEWIEKEQIISRGFGW